MISHSYAPLLFDGVSDFSSYLESLGIPYPIVMAYVAKLAELVGGFMLLVNYKSRFFASIIMAVMLVATFVAHKGLILTEGELAFNYLLLATILFFNPHIPFRIFKK
ncbi:MAG: hypothetical protein Aureis2KO_26640 [Aureisphaera sp.]